MHTKPRISLMKIISVFMLMIISLSLPRFTAFAVNSEGIILNTNDITLSSGKSYQLQWEIVPEEASQGATFYSDNTMVANVSDSGLILAVGKGSTYITVTSDDGFSFATCRVTVTENTDTEVIDLKDDTISLRTGSVSSLFYTYNKGEYVFTKAASFKSSDNNIAAVNRYGRIEAVSEGTATISATFGKTTKKCTVNVGEGSKFHSGHSVSGSLIDSSNKVYKNTIVALCTKSDKKNYFSTVKTDSFGKFTFSGIPNGKYTLAYYSPTAKKVINSGSITISGKDIKITGIINGDSLLTIDGELRSDKSTTPTEVKLTDEYLLMNVGDIESLEIITTPRDADVSKLKVTSTDKSVVDINDNGEIVAVKSGYADIVYTTPDSKSKAVCRITVREVESDQYSMLIIAFIFLSILVILLWFTVKYKKFLIKKRQREEMYE